MSFPSSGVPDALYFNELDIMRFLDRFKLLDENHGVDNAALIRKIPEYCELGIQEEVKVQDDYISED